MPDHLVADPCIRAMRNQIVWTLFASQVIFTGVKKSAAERPKNIPPKITNLAILNGWNMWGLSYKRHAEEQIRAERITAVHRKVKIRLDLRVIVG
ncbi:MAG: hypothetical protein EOP84_21240 [Verrucomicrobiaceae bacterium]|nr:MAG: hypothetical protein EOP84_21240 [Verrucomicrobiaceae bacterium]